MSAILLVDDNDLFAGMVAKMLERAGFEVIHASNGEVALRLYDPERVALVLTDLVMPDMEGIELIMALRRRHPGVRIIAMSGGLLNRSEGYLNLAQQLGADCTLGKPFTNEQLLSAVHGVLEVRAK
jgi:DNA-binding response OmpR family regulator